MKKLLFTLALVIASATAANAQLGLTAGYLHQTSTARTGETSRRLCGAGVQYSPSRGNILGPRC